MKKIILFTASILILTVGCVKEDYFGYSPYGNIKSIEISNQASQAVIDNDNYDISIEFPGGVELSALEIKTLTLSSFATSSIDVGDMIDLTQPAEISVTAEDGTVTVWTISPFVASSTPALDNGDLNEWYQSSGGYYEPGADAATTIWGTGNQGTQILNLLATTPLEISSGNYAANLETMDNGLLASTFGTPISAGSIFTGKFNKDNLDPSDPSAAVEFGTPFAGRPDKFQFQYQYEPGAVNKDKDGNVLPNGDECDVYAYLEIRSGSTVSRLATAWFRSGTKEDQMTAQEIDFVYGPLNSSYPDYMKPENGEYVSADSAQFVLPTHLIIVATSSYAGDIFGGAIGSKLVVDDFKLVYE